MSRVPISEMFEQEALCLPEMETIHNPVYQEYLTLAHKRWHFSDLLPMDKEKTILTSNKQKIKALNLLYHLYNTAADALYAFYIERKPELFDAHVGESACQIRAVKLAIMQSEINIRVRTDAICKYKTYQERAGKILEAIDMYQIPHIQIDGKIKLIDFINAHIYDLYINNNYLFLLLTFILDKFKKVISIDQDIIDYDKIIHLWMITKNQANNLIFHFQKICSYQSIYFIIQIAKQHNLDSKLLKYQLKRDLYGRWVLPMLTTMEISVQIIQAYSLPIAFKMFTNDEFEDYKYTIIYNNKFITDSNTIQTSIKKFHKPTIVFSGISNSNKITKTPENLCIYLNRLGLAHLIKTNAASHTAYTCPSLQNLNHNPYKPYIAYFPPTILESKISTLRDLQACAIIEGLCKHSPNTFAITHIICSMR